MVEAPANVSIISLEEFLFDTKTRLEVERFLEPVAGDTVIGTLPDNLVRDFVKAVQLEWQFEEFNDILKDRIAGGSVGLVRAGLDHRDFGEIQRQAQDIKVFQNDAEAFDYFRCFALLEATRHKVVLDIRTLFDNFTHKYDVRQGFRVVRLGKKYVL